jgi:RNA polymerase sigma-70 factor (ECF subfamily)
VFEGEVDRMTRTDAWFDQMYERHYRQILAYCLRRASRADADDAAAEVFAVAWRRRDDMPGGDRVLPWLYGVARRVLSHQRRGAGRRRRLAGRVAGLGEPPAPGPELVVVERHEYSQVRAAVGRLKPLDREVLLLAAWEGLSHRQIAEVLGCSQAAVDKRMVRAKARLAKQYQTLARFTTRRPPASAAGGGGSR